MLKNRIFRLAISLSATLIFMMILVLVTPDENPDRILVMLGGVMPEGLIQAVTYFFFFWGILEMVNLNNQITYENDAFSAHLLPEEENWILSADDVNNIKLKMQDIQKHDKFLLSDLIRKSCTKYRLGKSSSEVLGLVESQVKTYNSAMESEQEYIRYCAWAIPSIGFIGTVVGIAASLGFANEAGTQEGINKMTSMLAVAFDTTLVALVLSVFLMFGIHYLQKKQDKLFALMTDYVIDNLINRFYK